MSSTTTKRKISDRWRSGSPSRKADWLILAALLLHGVDFFFGFSWALIPVRILFHVITVFILCFMLRENWKQQLPYLAGISVFMLFGYPGIQYLLLTLNVGTFITMLVTTAMGVLPLMAIYLMSIGITYPFNPEEQGVIVAFFKAIFFFRFTQWVKMWIFFWILLGVINLAGVAMTQAENIPSLPGASVNPVEVIKTAGEFASQSFEVLINGINSLFTATKFTYNQYMNNTLGGYYTSRVEDTNRVKPGISITNFKSEGRYYEGIGNRITFAPRIVVKLFDDNVSKIKINCIAFDVNNRTRNVTGELQGLDETFGFNSGTISIYKQDQRTVFCRFNTNSNNMLTEGRYRVEFSAEFNYSTWAYSNYIFMDRDYIEALKASGEDPNRKFGIPEKIETLYTMGPAMVGMRRDMLGGLPIGLSTISENFVPIGVTLDNLDKVNGEILNVNSFEVKIPEEFRLDASHCSSEPVGPFNSEVPGYSTYSFHPNNINLKQSYLTIDCDMQATSTNARTILGGIGGMSQATIAVKVNYNYLLKNKMSITVEKDPTYRG